MRRRVGLLAGALPALALCWSGAIHGQDAAATDASAKPAPETIAQADIPTRADADERFARDVIQRSTGRDPTEKFGPRLDALGESVREPLRQLLAPRSTPARSPARSAWAATEGKISQEARPKTRGEVQFSNRERTFFEGRNLGRKATLQLIPTQARWSGTRQDYIREISPVNLDAWLTADHSFGSCSR